MNITFKNVSYTYQPNTPLAHQALKNIDLNIKSGSFTCIAGKTGAGKSTLVQLINGLLKPTSGELQVGSITLGEGKNNSIKQLRQHVAMVFQYPEHQLFEETVKKDLLFGPRNFGLKVTDEQVEKVIHQVGLDTTVLEKSPFELSGGQKRRVAIACSLILKPFILILDEPTAGLDPVGQMEMMELFKTLHEAGMTVIMITHHMEHALRHADQILIFDQGQLTLSGTPQDLFSNTEQIEGVGLAVPEVILFINEVNRQLGINLSYKGQTVEELAREVVNALKVSEVN
ncbi:energy-coupling factor transporter ATPase [Piscibacillus sp. B03]|uniref:energy-coupling factor transporter ATPase n=1 Tax=Piscibacillus sp. B03 TaxID=3457430 RepID=UPI003FCD5961